MDFTSFPIETLAPWPLLAIVFLAIVTGRLVPRSTYQDMKDDRDAIRIALRTSEEQNRDLMLSSSRVAEALLKALPLPEEEQK